MKDLVKKWWFWAIVLIIFIVIYILISSFIKNKRQNETINNIGKGASDFLEGINNSESHIDDFFYNYETGKVEYKPLEITLEMYNCIKDGMKEDDVIAIMGKYERKLDGENTYLLEWGNSNLSKDSKYWMQIIFDKNKTVLSKSQIGLK